MNVITADRTLDLFEALTRDVEPSSLPRSLRDQTVELRAAVEREA